MVIIYNYLTTGVMYSNIQQLVSCIATLQNCFHTVLNFYRFCLGQVLYYVYIDEIKILLHQRT